MRRRRSGGGLLLELTLSGWGLCLPRALGGGYVKVINGRCGEFEGVLPLGAPNRSWTEGLDTVARDWCDRRSRWCAGYMRYLGSEPEHCDAWCGRPQFCNASSLALDEQWVSYMREESFTDEASPSNEEGAVPTGIAEPEHQDIVCSWPYTGSLTLWLEEPLSTEDTPDTAAGVAASEPAEEQCRVLLHRRGRPRPSGVGSLTFHGILSEDEDVAPYFTANTSAEPWVYSVDRNEYIGETVDSGGTFGPKRHYLSVFFLSKHSTCDGQEPGQWGPEEAEEVFPGHVFVDDGQVETRRGAFNPYHFTVICGSLEEAGFIPQALVDALGFATHPLVERSLHRRLHRAFFHLPDAVQPYSRIHPKLLEKYVEDLYTDPGKNEAMYFKQTFLFLLQDLFRYRYRQEPARRLEAAACALCEDRRRRGRVERAQEAAASEGAPAAGAAVGVAVCVMSRRSGHALRAAIRGTWARRAASRGAALRFFVGRGDGAAVADAAAGDVVELQAPEAYQAVTLKAFSMLAWAHHAFPSLRFLIRSDDDVYLRPGPLLAQLERRPPVAYLWGNFDHGSNPVRDPGHQHYNSPEQFPKRRHPLFGDIFPPYARGHLWAMSADLLAHIVDLWRGELLTQRNVSLALAARLPHPDDPALGVALANLVDQDEVSLNIDDRDLNVFALNPSCNATYLNIHRRTWVVHHVDAEAMRCMWAIDEAAGEPLEARGSELPDLCPCSMEVVEEVMEGPEDEPFDYPRMRFNE